MSEGHEPEVTEKTMKRILRRITWTTIGSSVLIVMTAIAVVYGWCVTPRAETKAEEATAPPTEATIAERLTTIETALADIGAAIKTTTESLKPAVEDAAEAKRLLRYTTKEQCTTEWAKTLDPKSLAELEARNGKAIESQKEELKNILELRQSIPPPPAGAPRLTSVPVNYRNDLYHYSAIFKEGKCRLDGE